MKKLGFAIVLFAASVLAAQDNAGEHKREMKDAKGEITIQGCVGRSGGDYVLTKQNPAITYELQATGKTKLRKYMGQRVEVTGHESTSLSTSSDAMNKTGSAAPTTLTISSIRTIDSECTTRQAEQ